MAFRLRITEGKGAGKKFTFAQSTVRIGRLPDNDLVLYDIGVSRYHCEILKDGDSYTLRDTGSSNGTLLNEAVTTEAQIGVGDRIQVGPIVFTFETLKKTGDKEPVALPSRKEMFRPPSERQRRRLEMQATSAFERSNLEAPQRTIEQPAADNEGCTKSGSFVSYERPAPGLRALPRSTRLALLTGAAVIGIGGTVSALILKHRPRQDRSAEIFLADRSNAALSFGQGKVDIYTPDRTNFQFDYTGGRIMVTYAAGGIEGPKELEMLVNGRHVLYVRPSPGRWTTGLKTILPRRLLKSGTNVLTFDNRMTPGHAERWGVAQVQIDEEELPPPDEKKAEELLELGQAAYDTRSVAPQNLSRAVQYYQDARRYLEGLNEPPTLMSTIEKAETLAAAELQAVYDSYLFAAEKSLRFGDRDGAANSLRELLRYFPDREDPRHKEARKKLTHLIGRQ